MKKYIVEVHDDRTIWKNEAGEKHREDGPAVETVKGHKEWWVNGVKHRADGPAIIYWDGCYCWLLDGELHREGGPAIENERRKEWYYNGQRHRTDGPAIITKDDTDPSISVGWEWFEDDVRHRLDGPAVIWSDGTTSWHIEGKSYTKEEFDAFIKSKNNPVKELTVSEIESLLGHKVKVVRDEDVTVQPPDPYDEGSKAEMEDVCPYPEKTKEYEQWYMGLYDEHLMY